MASKKFLLPVRSPLHAAFLTVVLILGASAGGYYVRGQQTDLADCNLLLATAQRENAEVCATVPAEPSAEQTESPSASEGLKTLAVESAPVAPDVGGSASDDLKDYWAEEQVKRVEKIQALSAEERSRLLEELRKDSSIQVAASKAFGDDWVNSYQERLAKAREERINSDRERDVLYLSKLLSLTPEQEAATRKALSEVDRTTAPLQMQISEEMDGTVSLHSAPESDGRRVELRERYRTLRALVQAQRSLEEEALTAQLRGVMTDEQFNRLLEERAKGDDLF